MKKIIHISDLHFGRENKDMVPILRDTISEFSPDLVIISGDLTQRATIEQFKQANTFLNSLNCQLISVPGNHDIPLYNIFSRFLNPYKKYQKYINADLNPQYCDDEMMILGINSSVSTQSKNGRISIEQLNLIKNYFSHAQPSVRKILIMHHNLIMLRSHHHPIVNYKDVTQIIVDMKIDLVLSGHLHFPYLEILSSSSNIIPQKLFHLTAGTALSTRLRNNENSFNYIYLEKDKFTLEIYNFCNGKFNLNTRNQHFFV